MCAHFFAVVHRHRSKRTVWESHAALSTRTTHTIYEKSWFKSSASEKKSERWGVGVHRPSLKGQVSRFSDLSFGRIHASVVNPNALISCCHACLCSRMHVFMHSYIMFHIDRCTFYALTALPKNSQPVMSDCLVGVCDPSKESNKNDTHSLWRSKQSLDGNPCFLDSVSSWLVLNLMQCHLRVHVGHFAPRVAPKKG